MPYVLYVYTCVKQVGTLSPASACAEHFAFTEIKSGSLKDL